MGFVDEADVAGGVARMGAVSGSSTAMTRERLCEEKDKTRGKFDFNLERHASEPSMQT